MVDVAVRTALPAATVTAKPAVGRDRVLAVLRDRPRDIRGIAKALDLPPTGNNLRNVRTVVTRLFNDGKLTRVYNDKFGAYIWHIA